MVKTNELKAVMVREGKSQKDVAKACNITPKTFYLKMKKGIFGSNEIEIMMEYLHIDNPMDIFFAPDVN